VLKWAQTALHRANPQSKYHNITQDELREIKASQEFINAKFEQLSKTIEDLQCQNEFLKQENSQIKANATEMSNRIIQLEEDQEAQNIYSRRDCLELHGIPIQSGEDTDKLVQKVGDLVGTKIKNEDISISHRLPTRGNRTPIIIAKFTRRSVQDYH
jgi:chromosome segregation ATPase